MRFVQGLGWPVAEWYRRSLVATLLILVVGVIVVDLNSRQLLALLPLAVVVVAVATIDFSERPLSKLFLKLMGILMGAILAYYTLRTDAGEDMYGLIWVLANLISISGMIFAIFIILGTSWPLLVNRRGRS